MVRVHQLDITDYCRISIERQTEPMLMKYYGIAAIPTQVLLDKGGREFFRHTGYIEARELIINFKLNQ